MFNFNFQKKDVKRVIKSSSYSMRDPNRAGANKIKKAPGYKKVQTKAARTSTTVPTLSFEGTAPVTGIYGVVVCVNYSDFFKHSIESAGSLFDKLYVVTDNDDKDTEELCRNYPFIELIKTDVFYSKKAKFDKGAGINQALKLIPKKKDIWVLIFDADIVFPSYARK